MSIILSAIFSASGNLLLSIPKLKSLHNRGANMSQLFLITFSGISSLGEALRKENGEKCEVFGASQEEILTTSIRI